MKRGKTEADYLKMIEDIFNCFLEFTKKVENAKIRNVKEWICIPNECGETCLMDLANSVTHMQWHRVI